MASTEMDIEAYAKRTQFYTEDVPPLLSKFLDNTEWNTCLDLGCGDGALLYALNKKGYFAGKTVYGVDLSTSRLQMVSQINSDIICLARDVCDTQVEDASIDFLISTQVIEHVESDAKMVAEIYRILAPTGTVYLSTIFKKWYGWYFYRCNGKWTIDPTHVREYTHDDQLLDILKNQNLQILEFKKTLDGRPLMDALLRRVGARNFVYNNRMLNLFRGISIPIPGYYIWEIVARKN
jgi:2-polyprenyl-3-methyl-5-hydroxy-6-metoxy-1,4-benzoquinol methylase